METHAPLTISQALPALSNAEIADRLASLAQLLSTQKENPYKVKAYRRAAASIRTLSESIDELVREEADLTRFEGIGEAISSAIREIVLTGSLGKLEKLRSEASPALASISAYPRLDPKRVLRIYKKLDISSVDELREQLESGAIEKALGQRMAQHVRQGLTETHGMLLYRADDLRDAVEEFLVAKCGVRRAEVAGRLSPPGGNHRRNGLYHRDGRLSFRRRPGCNAMAAGHRSSVPRRTQPSLPFHQGFSCGSSWPRPETGACR